MNQIKSLIPQLRTQLQTLHNQQGKTLWAAEETLKTLTPFAENIASLWAGAWGQANVDIYRLSNDPDNGERLTADELFKRLKKKTNVDLDALEKNILESLDPYKKFQKNLVSEFALIRDKEGFTNEQELLSKLEKFKWGIESTEIIKYQQPKQIITYDYDAVNRGLKTPPHLIVNARIASLSTKAFVSRNFEDDVTRLLRQVELKLSDEPSVGGDDYTRQVLTDIFDHFHQFAVQLQNRHGGRTTIEVKDEYDVQDLLHAILKLHFADVRPEEHTPSLAGGSARMDFLLKKEQMVIEVKKTRERLSEKEVGDQLILDIARYRNHANCKCLLCFVYDPENRIRNPRGLESDLNKLSSDDMAVEVYIRP